jgi:hypothetical protein
MILGREVKNKSIKYIQRNYEIRSKIKLKQQANTQIQISIEHQWSAAPLV